MSSFMGPEPRLGSHTPGFPSWAVATVEVEELPLLLPLRRFGDVHRLPNVDENSIMARIAPDAPDMQEALQTEGS